MATSPGSSEVLTSGPVVVGVDGSADAERALRVAGAVARSMGVDLRVVHALGLMTTIGGHKVPAHDHRAEITELLREQWCAPVREIGDLQWSCELRDGSPAEVVIDLARETGACMVVVGARGIGGQTAQMLGSTSHHVVQHCPCPTLIVPAGR